jgi:hypothetical protein
MSEAKDWWDELLASRKADGRRDADEGVYDPPYPGSEDPTDDYENGYYKQGLDERRAELGTEFRWS